MAETGLDRQVAINTLDAAGNEVSVALVMTLSGCGVAEAKDALARSRGVVREAIKVLRRNSS
jgi:N-acetylmuramic acid 6-phosphate (MurNAc-6-P) etherase